MSAPADRQQPSLSTAGYIDGLGRRTLRFDREVGGMLQALELRPEFSLFETLLRDSAAKLGVINDPRVAGILSIEREAHGLVVCSPLVSGERLEDLLDARSADDDAGPGIDAALGFLVRVVPALTLLHRAGIVHGILAPGRLALTASGDVVLLDCIYAAAVERVRLSRERLWSSLGVAAPVTPGGTRLDRTTDVRQTALTAIAIALGRPQQELCSPQVLARLLQELGEVAQIRAGERFASDVCALLESATSMEPGSPRTLDEIGAEAQRLARSLGTGACVAALTAFAGIRAGGSDGRWEPAAVPAAPPMLPLEPVIPDEPGQAEEPLDEPELSLDVQDSVEISLDGTDGLDFDASDDPVLVLDATDAGSALFDWQPDLISVPRPVEDVVALVQPDTTDWVPPAESVDEIAEGQSGPESEAEPEPWQPEVIPEPMAADPGAAELPLPLPVEAIEPPVMEFEAPALAIDEPVAAPATLPAPAPPPGIPLFRAASPPRTPAVPPASGTRDAEERRGLKLYVPPQRSMPPAQAVQTPVVPAPIFTAPSPVVVVAQAPVPTAPLRLKEDPALTPRPRRMLEGLDAEAIREPGTPRSALSPKRAWKLVAAAAVVLAVGAFAGLPLVTGGTEPAAAEAAPAAPRPVEPPPVSAGSGGALHIETQPSGAAVLLDGEDVGRTPLKLEDVKPGRHSVTLSTDSATVKRTVRIEAGKVVTLDVPVYSGWVVVYSPVLLHISEGSRTLGTTDTSRVMLSPGRHELTLTNRELGYAAKHTVEIVAGEERVLNVEPKGTVSVNALPWAEVWVDGTRMGETPLANLEVPLGTREFVFKHPTYGERRVTTTITSNSPPLSVDFTRPGTRP